jgi:CBS domain-containing protein
MKVREIMHNGVEWANPDTPVSEIANLMRETDIGAVPVGENDRLVGMVTDRDICCAVSMTGFDPKQTKARDVMSKGIHCCSTEDGIEDAVHHMETLKVRRLPVIDENKRMVGMLSLGDISRYASGRAMSEWAKGVSAPH